MGEENKLVVFQDKKIRRIWHNDEWYFSVIDVVAALEASTIPKRYWADLKVNLLNEGFGLYDKIVRLKLTAPDGKLRLTDCANTENMFRIIQSIPSKKAEPFKRWLAKVGYERVQEIENPELAQKRMKELYRKKGYSDGWIEKRIRGIEIRDELTGEWKKRDVNEGKEFAILTSEISKETFGMTPDEYKKFKNLKNENLRDHMNGLELIFTMLGEGVSTEITRAKDSRGFNECEDSAIQGGKVAGNARIDAEKRIGRQVSTKENFKKLPGKEKKQLEK